MNTINTFIPNIRTKETSQGHTTNVLNIEYKTLQINSHSSEMRHVKKQQLSNDKMNIIL